MNKLFFVSETYLKNNSPINLNVDGSLLSTAIQNAQKIELQQLLGTKLFKKIEDLLIAGSGDIVDADDYKTLFTEYIQPVVCYWALVKSLTAIRYKIVNKSIVLQSSENSEPIQLEEFKMLKSELANEAEFYSNRLKDYLCENADLFSEYSGSFKTDEIVPNASGYRTKIYLGTQYNEELKCYYKDKEWN